MADPFKIAIAGLGTVGAGLVDLLQKNADLIAARAGRPIEIIAVSARDQNKDRGVDLSGYAWAQTPQDLLTHNPDCLVELIGGENGPAPDLVNAALDQKIHMVTANKALLAHHGLELAQKAEQAGVALAYEASVAGGIPIIKAMREGLAGNNITRLYGILNGTCNYILTEMRETGRAYEDVLKEAQEKGYAEADPSFDVDGIDAAHKLCLLTALAFGTKPGFKSIDIQGISGITSADISEAEARGYKIKLLGMSEKKEGRVLQSVRPCLIPAQSALGNIEGVMNAVYVEAQPCGPYMATGRGAGAGPTASAVAADIIDLAKGHSQNMFGLPADDLADIKMEPYTLEGVELKDSTLPLIEF